MEASAFHHEDDDLRSQEATPLITLANLYDGHTTGVELAGNLQLHARWLVHGSYTGQRVSLKPLPESKDTTNARAEADDPAHMFSVRSGPQPPGRFAARRIFPGGRQIAGVAAAGDIRSSTCASAGRRPTVSSCR